MSQNQHQSFATRAVHAGERAEPGNYIPVVTPIHPTVGYFYESMDELDEVFATTRSGFVYPRYGSPTVQAFEAAVADLEGGEAAHAFASGMAAIHASLLSAGLQAGTSIVAALDLYGATYTLLNNLFSKLGVSIRMVDVSNSGQVETAIKEAQPAAVLVETISNPLLKIADIPSLVDLAHHFGAQFLVDNTFASPYLVNPLRYGADYVIHSATKYLGGHGDVMAGVVITSQENRKKLYELNKIVGGVLGPFEAWLAMRGLKTLPLRVRQQCAGAVYVAERLAKHPRVARVIFPGLDQHPQHDLAENLFEGKGFGSVLSFEIKGAGKAEVFRFMEKLQVCLPAATMGDIYSLVLHPMTASHRGLTPEERARVGIPDGLVRLSVGIEDPEDIWLDIKNALEI